MIIKMTQRQLPHLAEGQKACLLDTQSRDVDIIRLIEMGMTAGAEVTLLSKAPFGCPIRIAICGTELCLRLQQASQFWVQPLEA